MSSKELLKGTLKTIILKLLSSQDKMYGYEITQKVKLLTQGEFVLTEGALYPSLHKLEADGLLQHEIKKVGNRTRKYYSLTKKGEKASEEKQDAFHNFTKWMKVILNQ